MAASDQLHKLCEPVDFQMSDIILTGARPPILRTFEIGPIPHQEFLILIVPSYSYEALPFHRLMKLEYHSPYTLDTGTAGFLYYW
jgi:hypothetical protein